MKRIVWALAGLVAFVALSLTLFQRFGPGGEVIALNKLDTYLRVYDYNQKTEIQQAGAEFGITREAKGQLQLKGRSAQGGNRRFNPNATLLNFHVTQNGEELEQKLMWEFVSRTMDSRGRPLGEKDLPGIYPIDMICAPEFFPFLPPFKAQPGDEWEDQFRMIYGPKDEVMIVRLVTEFLEYDTIDAERLARMRFTIEGEAFYRDAEKQANRKATLTGKGAALWNVILGAPNKLDLDFRLEILDYDEWNAGKAGKDADKPGFARVYLRDTKTHVSLNSKVAITPTPGRRTTATPKEEEPL